MFFLLISCDGDGGDSVLGSGISKTKCDGQWGIGLNAIGRGGLCACDGEFRGEFRMGFGNFNSPEDEFLRLILDHSFFLIQLQDSGIHQLFNPTLEDGFTTSVPGGGPVGEIIDLGPVSQSDLVSVRFMLVFGDGLPEEVVCPACYAGPMPLECDIEAEIDEPKCLDNEELSATGSGCPADSIIRVCEPYICGMELAPPGGVLSIAIDFFPIPSDNSSAMGCNTIVQGAATFTEIFSSPPTGTAIVEGVFESGPGTGPFGCGFVPF